ncbi:MAG: site-specific integrase [Pseudomonadota bacterium]
MTRDEADRLLEAAQGSHHIHRFITLGLYTGTRRGALLALQWLPNTTGGHIDLDKGLLFRRSADVAESKKRQPTARLPDWLIEQLTRWRRDTRQYVIEYRGIAVRDVKTGFNASVRRAGLSGVTPHVLRHTAITWAMQDGVRLSSVSQFFGISVAELERTYFHHHPDYQADIVESLGRKSRYAERNAEQN